MGETLEGVSGAGGYQSGGHEGGGGMVMVEGVGGTNWRGRSQRGYASAGWDRVSVEREEEAGSPGK